MKISFKFIEILLVPFQTLLMFYFVPTRLLILSTLYEMYKLFIFQRATVATFIFLLSIIYTMSIVQNNRDMMRIICCFGTFYLALRLNFPSHVPKNTYLVIILFFILTEKFTLSLGFLFNVRDESGALFLFGEKSYASQIIFILVILFGDWENRKYITSFLSLIIFYAFGGGLSMVYMICIVSSLIFRFSKAQIIFLLTITFLLITYFSNEIFLSLIGLVATGVIDYADSLRPLLNILSFQESSLLGSGQISIYNEFLLADDINRPWNMDWESVSGQAILPILAYSIGWIGVGFMLLLLLSIDNKLTLHRDYLLCLFLIINLMLQSNLISIINFVIVATLNKHKKINVN